MGKRTNLKSFVLGIAVLMLFGKILCFGEAGENQALKRDTVSPHANQLKKVGKRNSLIQGESSEEAITPSLPPICFYKGQITSIPGPVPLFIRKRIALTEIDFEREQGQQFKASATLINVTSDIVGVLVRIGRLKQSEGEHPSDIGDNHGNPMSDEDKVELLFYIAPGYTPDDVFEGYEKPSKGGYDICGVVIPGQDIPIVFDNLQADKEYRVTCTAWSEWIPDEPGENSFTLLDVQETRFRLDKFQEPSSKRFQVSRNQFFEEGDDIAKALISAKWHYENANSQDRYRLRAKSNDGPEIFINEQPLAGTIYEEQYETLIESGAAEGTPLGVEKESELVSPILIGGGSIVIDKCDLCSMMIVPVPTNLVAEMSGQSTVHLTWLPPSSTVDGYKIYRKGGSCTSIGTWAYIGSPNSPNETYYYDTVTPGQTYSYKVSSTKGGCESAMSNCVTILATCTNCETLAVPSPLLPTPGQSNVCNKTTFYWQTMTGAQGYALEVFINADGSGSPYLSYQITGGNSNHYTIDQRLPLNTTCSYKVMAIGDGLCYCNSEYSQPIAFTTVAQDCNYLSSPSNVTPCGATNICRQPAFTWTTSAYCSGYLLEVYQSPNCSGTPIISQNIGQASTTSWTPSSALAVDTTYCWRVKALGGSDPCGYCDSDYSIPCSFTTNSQPDQSVNILEPSNGATNQLLKPTLKWDENSGIYNIVVYSGISCAGAIVSSGTVSNQNYWQVSTQLVEGTYYSWQVSKEEGGCAGAISSCAYFEVGDGVCP